MEDDIDTVLTVAEQGHMASDALHHAPTGR